MKYLKRITTLFLALGSLIALTNCGSTVGVGSGSGALASTQANNTSRARVDAAVKSVFQEEGFALIGQRSNSFHFQKWGGTSAQVIYGSWFSEGVAIEPEVEVVQLSPSSYSLLCNVYMREHNGSELLDANWKLLGSGKVAYNKLMKKIKKRAELPLK